MNDLDLAMRSRVFRTLAQETIRKQLPRRFDWEVDLPWGGDDDPLHISLGLLPIDVLVHLQDNGDLHLDLEIDISILEIRHGYDLNRLYPEGETVEGSDAVMPKVPKMPVEMDLREDGLIIARPKISLDIDSFKEVRRIEDGKPVIDVFALVSKPSIVVSPNIAGLFQSVVRRMTGRIQELVEGAFGQTHLAEVLSKVVGFLGSLLQKLLNLVKLPDILVHALADGLEDVLRAYLRQHWSFLEVKLFEVPGAIRLADARTLSNGQQRPEVNIEFAHFLPSVNADRDGAFEPEFQLGIELTGQA